MDIAILGFDRALEDISANIARTEKEGFSGYWVPNGRGSDALTALAVAGASATIRLGTAVVPIHPRHPIALAQHALTVNKIVGGRLALGLGVSHRPMVEDSWGLSFERPVTYLAEYLEALLPLLADQQVALDGERVSVHAAIDIDAPSCPVFLAALGPRMLELAGRLTAGTVTWMVGLETVRTLTAPTINAAAEAAGRDAPEIVVGLPVTVTDDVATAREKAGESLQIYGTLPSYRAMLDREGLAGPADLCVVGSEDEVAESLGAFIDAGATCIAASPTGTDEERERTRACLASLVS